MADFPAMPLWTDINRDEDGVAHIVPISGGKDSTCLALALKEREPRPYTYLFTPTGDELPEMVSHMAEVERLLGSPILRLTNGTLASVIEDNKMLPNFRARFCTRILKLKPSGIFYEKAAPCVCYVGIRDDEDEREGFKPGRDSSALSNSVQTVFPFQHWGWGIDEVWGFLDERSISIPERTDCAKCFFQKLGEWYNLWRFHPEIYASAEEDEARYGHTYRSPGRDSWPASLRELREMFEAGHVPNVSLRMMDKRKGMCRTCLL